MKKKKKIIRQDPEYFLGDFAKYFDFNDLRNNDDENEILTFDLLQRAVTNALKSAQNMARSTKVGDDDDAVLPEFALTEMMGNFLYCLLDDLTGIEIEYDIIFKKILPKDLPRVT